MLHDEDNFFLGTPLYIIPACVWSMSSSTLTSAACVPGMTTTH